MFPSELRLLVSARPFPRPLEEHGNENGSDRDRVNARDLFFNSSCMWVGINEMVNEDSCYCLRHLPLLSACFFLP